MKLRPHIVCKIWGGKLLSSLKKIDSKEPIGESWELSILPEGESSFMGKKLSTLIDSTRLPYLIKFIDTSDTLSVQVHPDEFYASQNENAKGKTECWLILEAGEGAGIYLGFIEGVTKEKFEKAIRAREDLTPYLRFYPVKKGDFFYVPAGSVHAIGKNVFLAEVQESSGITYRVWDFNRLEKGKPRELHIDKALDVLNFAPEANEAMYFRAREDLFSYNGEQEILTEKLFKLDLINLVPNEVLEKNLLKSERPISFVCFEGKGLLRLKENELFFESYETILIPAEDEGTLEIFAHEKVSFILVS